MSDINVPGFIAFLNGEVSLEGHWFGSSRRVAGGILSSFWWRSYLPKLKAAFYAKDDEIAALSARVAELESRLRLALGAQADAEAERTIAVEALAKREAVAVPDEFEEWYGSSTAAHEGPYEAASICWSAGYSRGWNDASESQQAKREAVADGFYIACFRHPGNGFALWWGPNFAGYTPYLEQAGIYTDEQVRDRGFLNETCEDVPVPVAYARGLSVSLVDVGHTKARTFWSAAELRTALAASQQAANKGDA